MTAITRSARAVRRSARSAIRRAGGQRARSRWALDARAVRVAVARLRQLVVIRRIFITRQPPISVVSKNFS